jgi:hypothetical protein
VMDCSFIPKSGKQTPGLDWFYNGSASRTERGLEISLQQIGGYNPEFMYCQAYDLCLRLSEVTDIAQLHKPLYRYRHHRNSISCEKQIDQIFYGRKAIENAIVRRGMADTHELEFQVFAHCTLLKKSPVR